MIGLDDDLAGFLVALEVGGEAALVADAGGVVAFVEDALQGVEGLGPIAERLGEVRRADGHDHEFLKIDAVVGVLAAVENVHHRHRQPHRPGPAQIGVERQVGRHRRRPGNRHRNAKDGVGPQLALGGRAVQVDHQAVDLGLLRRVETQELRGDGPVDVGHGLEHALAAVAFLVAVAEFQGFVLAGGGPRGHRGRGRNPVVQGDMDPHRRVAPRIENLQSAYRSNFRFHYVHFLFKLGVVSQIPSVLGDSIPLICSQPNHLRSDLQQGDASSRESAFARGGLAFGSE